MSALTRLPTKFGQSHADLIAWFQDELLPRLIANKIVVMSVCALDEAGDELVQTLTDVSGHRQYNQRLTAMLAEQHHRCIQDICDQQPLPSPPKP